MLKTQKSPAFLGPGENFVFAHRSGAAGRPPRAMGGLYPRGRRFRSPFLRSRGWLEPLEAFGGPRAFFAHVIVPGQCALGGGRRAACDACPGRQRRELSHEAFSGPIPDARQVECCKCLKRKRPLEPAVDFGLEGPTTEGKAPDIRTGARMPGALET